MASVSTNLIIQVGENESIEKALNRFRRMMRKEGLMTEIRQNMRFEKPSTKRRRKQALARRRAEKVQRTRPPRKPILRGGAS